MGVVNRFRGRSSRPTGSSETFPDRLFRWIVVAAATTVAALLVVFVIILVRGSWLTITRYGIPFLYGTAWTPNPPPGFPELYGALPFIVGTLLTSGIAMLIGIPVSLGIAIFLSELAPGWIRAPLSSLVELLAAVPSVVYGLWGFLVLVPVMRDSVDPALQQSLGWTGLFTGPLLGIGTLTAGVVLAIMVIPTISAVSRESMSAVPDSQREAALSLGATRWEATRVGVLSYARVGVFAGIILGLGRAVGETMAVTMTIGNSNTIPKSLFGPGQSIASLIANEFGEATPTQASALLELGLVLLLISIAINVVARLLTRRIFATEASTI